MPKNPIRRAVGVVVGMVVNVVYMGTLLVVNGVQMASLVVRPFSKRLFRRINRGCAHFWWGMCVVGSKSMHRVRTVFTGDDVPLRENAIVVANHQQMPDIIAIMFLAWPKKRLGDMKWMVKDVLKYVPGLGWGMAFLDCLFLKRNWSSDKASIDQTFSRFQKDKIPVWLVSFPEGTRITPAKLKRSNAFAVKAKMKPTETVLLPRTKGFVASVRGLTGHMDAVYDLTIGYPKGVPTLWQWTSGYVHEIHLHVRRFPVATLPKEPAQLSRWLEDRFYEKDAQLQRFQQTGSLV